MYYTINIKLELYDGIDSTSVDYPFNVTENFQDISHYLFEEEYGVRYIYNSWHLQDGSREFITNLEKLWSSNSIDLFTLYTKDVKFRDWLAEKYYEDAMEQYMREHRVPNIEEQVDENILELYE